MQCLGEQLQWVRRKSYNVRPIRCALAVQRGSLALRAHRVAKGSHRKAQDMFLSVFFFLYFNLSPRRVVRRHCVPRCLRGPFDCRAARTCMNHTDRGKTDPKSEKITLLNAKNNTHETFLCTMTNL